MWRTERIWGSTTRGVGSNQTFGHEAAYGCYGPYGQVNLPYPFNNRETVEKITAVLNQRSAELNPEG